jgi:hypothetical protein
MRVIADIPHPSCKISLFAWNQKYLVKFEQGACEQTFKISEFDVSGESELRERITDAFIQRVLARFESMHGDLQILAGHSDT